MSIFAGIFEIVINNRLIIYKNQSLMKKIFTKLFLLTTILMLSSELWAQAPEYVTCSSTLQPGAEGYATRVILENTNNYDCSPDVISFKTTAQEEAYPFQIPKR